MSATLQLVSKKLLEQANHYLDMAAKDENQGIRESLSTVALMLAALTDVVKEVDKELEKGKSQ